MKSDDRRSREKVNRILQAHHGVERRLSGDKVEFKNKMLENIEIEHETIVIVGFSSEMAKSCFERLRDITKRGKYKYILITGDENLANTLNRVGAYVEAFHADWSHADDIEKILTSIHVTRVKSVFFFHEENNKHTEECVFEYVKKNVFAFYDINFRCYLFDRCR